MNEKEFNESEELKVWRQSFLDIILWLKEGELTEKKAEELYDNHLKASVNLHKGFSKGV